MILKEVKVPERGDRRLRARFAWFPTWIRNPRRTNRNTYRKLVWLETYLEESNWTHAPWPEGSWAVFDRFLVSDMRRSALQTFLRRRDNPSSFTSVKAVHSLVAEGKRRGYPESDPFYESSKEDDEDE